MSWDENIDNMTRGLKSRIADLEGELNASKQLNSTYQKLVDKIEAENKELERKLHESEQTAYANDGFLNDKIRERDAQLKVALAEIERLKNGQSQD